MRLSTSDLLIKRISAAADKRAEINGLFGMPGHRKHIPLSLRKKVYRKVLPEHEYKPPKNTTPPDFRFRESLRRINIDNNTPTLSNRNLVIEALDKRINDIKHLAYDDICSETRRLAEVSLELDSTLYEEIRQRYSSLSYENIQDIEKKVLYGKMFLALNPEFKPGEFQIDDTDLAKLNKILKSLSPGERKMFIEIALFDEDYNDLDEIDQFIQSLEIITKSTDGDYSRETTQAIREASMTLVNASIEIGRKRIEASQGFERSGYLYFESGITTSDLYTDFDPNKNDEDDEDDYDKRNVSFENERHEIIIYLLRKKIIKLSQEELEKLYELGIYEYNREKFIEQIVKDINELKVTDKRTRGSKSEKIEKLKAFTLHHLDTRLNDNEENYFRVGYLISAYSELKAPEVKQDLVNLFDHEDPYRAFASYRALSSSTFGRDGRRALKEKIIDEQSKGRSRTLAIGLAQSSVTSNENYFKVLRSLFSDHRFNVVSAFENIDGIELPVTSDFCVTGTNRSVSLYEFISQITLPRVSEMIMHPANTTERDNAIKTFNMFPLNDRKLFIGTSEGKRLLKHQGIMPEREAARAAIGPVAKNKKEDKLDKKRTKAS